MWQEISNAAELSRKRDNMNLEELSDYKIDVYEKSVPLPDIWLATQCNQETTSLISYPQIAQMTQIFLL